MRPFADEKHRDIRILVQLRLQGAVINFVHYNRPEGLIHYQRFGLEELEADIRLRAEDIVHFIEDALRVGWLPAVPICWPDSSR